VYSQATLDAYFQSTDNRLPHPSADEAVRSFDAQVDAADGQNVDFGLPGSQRRFVSIFSAVHDLFAPARSRHAAFETQFHRLNAMARQPAVTRALACCFRLPFLLAQPRMT